MAVAAVLAIGAMDDAASVKPMVDDTIDRAMETAPVAATDAIAATFVRSMDEVGWEKERGSGKKERRRHGGNGGRGRQGSGDEGRRQGMAWGRCEVGDCRARSHTHVYRRVARGGKGLGLCRVFSNGTWHRKANHLIVVGMSLVGLPIRYLLSFFHGARHRRDP